MIRDDDGQQKLKPRKFDSTGIDGVNVVGAETKWGCGDKRENLLELQRAHLAGGERKEWENEEWSLLVGEGWMVFVSGRRMGWGGAYPLQGS